MEVEIAFDPADAGLLGAIGGVFGADGVTELIQQLLGAVLFHGLTPPLDGKGFRLYNFVIAGPARPPDRSLRPQVLLSEFCVDLP